MDIYISDRILNSKVLIRACWWQSWDQSAGVDSNATWFWIERSAPFPGSTWMCRSGVGPSVCLSDSRLGMDCIRSNDNQYGIRIVIPGRQTDLIDQIRDQNNCILLVTRSASTYPANKLVRGWLLKGRKRREGEKEKKTQRKNPRLFSVLMVFCSQPRRPVPSLLSCRPVLFIRPPMGWLGWIIFGRGWCIYIYIF